MKKILLGLAILFVIFFSAQAQETSEELSGIRKGVDPAEIKNINFHIDRRPDKVDGYVIFLDKDNRPCSTDGKLILSVKRRYVVGRTQTGLKPVEISRYDIDHTEEVYFRAHEFQLLGLPFGGIVYALPITLPKDKVQKDDMIVLEWQDLKVEQVPQEF